jgi:hypothetical protein
MFLEGFDMITTRWLHVLESVIVVLTLNCVVPQSQASIILVTGSDLSGSRSTPASAGLVGNGVWDGGGINFSWDISFNVGTSLWDYSYTLARTSINNPPGAGISHLLLELTRYAADGTSLDTHWKGIFGSANVDEWGDEGNSSPGIPGLLYGVKITPAASEELSKTFTFSTPQVPVWGDFYAKDGKAGGDENYAYNAGFIGDLGASQGGPAVGTTNFLNWVPRPDGAVGPPGGDPPGNVPEATSSIVWSILISGVGFWTARPRRGWTETE